MGSTIDALIAQGPRPVQTDPNAIANRIITLRQAAQGQQLQQQQIQAAQQENQQRAYQMDQTRALNNAYQAALTVDPNTGQASIDRNSLTHALAQAGHGSAIPGIMQSLNAYDKSNVDLQTARTALAKAEAEHAGSIGASVRAAKYDPQLFMTLTSDAVRQKHVEPQIVAPMMNAVQQALQADPSGAQARQVVQQFSDRMIAGSEKQRELDNAQTTADARKQASQTAADKFAIERPGLEADAATKQAVGAATLKDPNLLNPEQRQQATDRQTTQKETARHNAADEKAARTRNGIAAGELDLNQKKFDATIGAGLDANGKPLSDAELKAIAEKDPAAKMIANYQAPPPRNPSTGAGMAMMRKVAALNPDYHAEYFQTFQKTENDATTGDIAKQAGALNTMMGHLTTLNKAADLLNNSNLTDLNKLANAIGVHTGNSAITVYRTILHRLAPEITKAYVAGGGTSGERGVNEEDFIDSLGPQQIKQNIGISAHLADSKIRALQDQYTRGTYGRGQQKLISGDAEQARQTLTQQAPESLRGPQQMPNGGGKPLDDSTALQFLKAAGGDKAKARQMAISNGWKVGQ